MASIDKRPNGSYRARWREYVGGPQKVKVFTRKADAQKFLDLVQGDLARGMYIDPNGGRISFKAFAEQWRAGQIHRPSTTAQIEAYLRLHAYPQLGSRPIGSIRRSEIQSWVKGRSEVLAPGSVELVYRWVATIFKAAVADRLIPVSPCIRIALPKRERVEVLPLEASAVDALAGAIQPRYGALIVFAAGTGLRQGECFGVTVDRIDFLRRTVRVDRQLTSVANEKPRFAPPKSDAGRRTVPLPAVVVDALAAHLAEFGEGPDRLVFTTSQGKPLRRSTFNEAWHRGCKAAGVDDATFHDLRHFYASLLIAHGCSVTSVQKRLGHASAMETLDTYSHLWPDSEDQTRDAVDRVLSRGAAGPA